MSDDNERSVASAGSVAGEHRKSPASSTQVSLVPAEMYHALVVAHEEVARLRLTDAEQDAIEAAANAYQRRFDDGVGLLNDGPSECGKIAATLRGLLERTK